MQPNTEANNLPTQEKPKRKYYKGRILGYRLGTNEVQEFNSITDAANALDINTALICRVLRPNSGVKKTKGWRFEYAEPHPMEPTQSESEEGESL